MSRVVFSLRTALPAAAAKRASEVASRLDAHWFNLRIESDPTIRRFFRSSADRQIQIEEQTITHKKICELFSVIVTGNRPVSAA
jgi:hypothetical protein